MDTRYGRHGPLLHMGARGGPVGSRPLVCVAAPGPDRAHGGGDSQGRLFRRRDAGWEPISDVVADMPYGLAAPEPGTIVVGARSGEIRVSEDAGDTWRILDAKVPGILAIAAG